MTGRPVFDLTDWDCGNLKVQRRAERPAGKKDHVAWWLCKCKCGNETVVRGDALREGKTKSCGCSNGFGNIKRRNRAAKEAT